MLELLFNGRYDLVSMLLFVMILSLTIHEFGHAWMITKLGDNTALLSGRLTLNPVAHIDPMGLLMLIILKFGYAKPVPFTPRNIKQKWGQAAIAAAGPGMNFFMAFFSINIYVWSVSQGYVDSGGPAAFILRQLASVNILLMVFNLLPIGLLDGHYIMSWLLPPRLSTRYDYWNARYGNMLFLGLIMLSIAGLPIFSFLSGVSNQIAAILLVI